MCSPQKTQQALIKGIWLQRLGKLGADAHPSFLISFSAWKQIHVFSKMSNCSSDSEGEKLQHGHICPSERDHVCVHCSRFSPESIQNRFFVHNWRPTASRCVSIYSWGLLSLFQFEERCLKAAATKETLYFWGFSPVLPHHQKRWEHQKVLKVCLTDLRSVWDVFNNSSFAF